MRKREKGPREEKEQNPKNHMSHGGICIRDVMSKPHVSPLHTKRLVESACDSQKLPCVNSYESEFHRGPFSNFLICK